MEIIEQRGHTTLPGEHLSLCGSVIMFSNMLVTGYYGYRRESIGQAVRGDSEDRLGGAHSHQHKIRENRRKGRMRL